MPINIGNSSYNSTITSTGENFKVIGTDTVGSLDLFHIDSDGIPRDTSEISVGFHVGWAATGWTSITAGTDAVMNYTSGDGYFNHGNHYNTSNGRFTAPQTGYYLFYVTTYSYESASSSYGYWYRNQFYVNGSRSTRRTGGGPLQMRLYGLYANYVQDGDQCEIIFLVANDYVTMRRESNTTMEDYRYYCAWGGLFLGN